MPLQEAPKPANDGAAAQEDLQPTAGEVAANGGTATREGQYPAPGEITAAVEAHIATQVHPNEGPFTALLRKDLCTYVSKARSNPAVLPTFQDPHRRMVEEILAILPQETAPDYTGSPDKPDNQESSQERHPVKTKTIHPESTITDETSSPPARKIRQTRKFTKSRILKSLKNFASRYGSRLFLGLAGTTGATAAYLESRNQIEVLPDPLPDAVDTNIEITNIPESVVNTRELLNKSVHILAKALSQMIAVCVDSLPDDYPIKAHLQYFGENETEDFIKSIINHYLNQDPDGTSHGSVNSYQIILKLLMNSLPRVGVAKMDRLLGLALRGRNLIILNAHINDRETLRATLMHEFLHSKIQGESALRMPAAIQIDADGNLSGNFGRNFKPLKTPVLEEGVTELKARQISEIRSGVYEKLTYRAFLLELFNLEKLNELYAGMETKGIEGAALKKSFQEFLDITDLNELQSMWEDLLLGRGNLEKLIASAKVKILSHALKNSETNPENRRMGLITAILANHLGLDVHENLETMFAGPEAQGGKESTSAFTRAVAEAKEQYAQTGYVEKLPTFFEKYLEPLSEQELNAMTEADMEAFRLALQAAPILEDGDTVIEIAIKKILESIIAILLVFFTLKKIRKRENLAKARLGEELLLQIAALSGNRRLNQLLYHDILQHTENAIAPQENPEIFVENAEIIMTLTESIRKKKDNTLLQTGLGWTVGVGAMTYLTYFNLLNLSGIILGTASIQCLRWLCAQEYGHFAVGTLNNAAGRLREFGRKIAGFNSNGAIHEATQRQSSDPKPVLFEAFEKKTKGKNLKPVKYRSWNGHDRQITSIDMKTGLEVTASGQLETREDWLQLATEESRCSAKPDKMAALKIDVELKESEEMDGYFEFSNNLYLIRIVKKSVDSPEKYQLVPGPSYDGRIEEKFFHRDRYELKDFEIFDFEFTFRDKSTGETHRIRERKPAAPDMGIGVPFISAVKGKRKYKAEDLGHLITRMPDGCIAVTGRGESKKIKLARFKKLLAEGREMELRKTGKYNFEYLPRQTAEERASYKPILGTSQPHSSPVKLHFKFGETHVVTFTDGRMAAVFENGETLEPGNFKGLHLGSGKRNSLLLSTIRHHYPDKNTEGISMPPSPFSCNNESIAANFPIDCLTRTNMYDLFTPVELGTGEYSEETRHRGAPELIAGLCRNFGLELLETASEYGDEEALTLKEKTAILTSLAARLPGKLLIEEASQKLRQQKKPNRQKSADKRKRAQNAEPRISNAHGPDIITGRHIGSSETGDFEAFSQYQAGDDPRHLDWHSSARGDRLLVRRYAHSRETEVAKRNLVITVDSLIDESRYLAVFTMLFEALRGNGHRKFENVVLVAAGSGHYESISLAKVKIGNLPEAFDAIIARAKSVLGENPNTEAQRFSISKINRKARKRRARQNLPDEDLLIISSIRSRLQINKPRFENFKLPPRLKSHATKIGFAPRGGPRNNPNSNPRK